MTSHRVPETSRTGWGWGAGGAPSSGRAGGRGSRGSEGILGSPSGCVGGGGAHGGVGEDPGRELLLSLLEAGPGAAVQGVDLQETAGMTPPSQSWLPAGRRALLGLQSAPPRPPGPMTLAQPLTRLSITIPSTATPVKNRATSSMSAAAALLAFSTTSAEIQPLPEGTAPAVKRGAPPPHVGPPSLSGVSKRAPSYPTHQGSPQPLTVSLALSKHNNPTPDPLSSKFNSCFPAVFLPLQAPPRHPQSKQTSLWRRPHPLFRSALGRFLQEAPL